MNATVIFWSTAIVCYLVLLTIGVYLERKARQNKLRQHRDEQPEIEPNYSGLMIGFFMLICAIVGLILQCFHIIE